MQANDDTPPSGECVSDEQLEYQLFAEELLAHFLRQKSGELNAELSEAVSMAERGVLGPEQTREVRAAYLGVGEALEFVEEYNQIRYSDRYDE